MASRSVAWARRVSVTMLVGVLVGLAACSALEDSNGADQPRLSGGERRSVAVVSDSEITPEIVELIAADPGIEIVYRYNAPGATITELDDMLQEALATEPDALIYTAGANDLLESGIEQMLESLRVRLDQAGDVTCVVYAVPAVDVAEMKGPDAQTARATLEAFSKVIEDWGVLQVPYLAVADQMAANGEEFFAGGDLGSFHPGEAAYPAIASALIDGLDQCR